MAQIHGGAARSSVVVVPKPSASVMVGKLYGNYYERARYRKVCKQIVSQLAGIIQRIYRGRGVISQGEDRYAR